MPLLRFRVYWEEDDQTYRDIELRNGQTFLEFHQVILKAYEFDGKHPGSFFESNERWQRGREISSEVLVNKKDAPALSMAKTPVSALVTKPDQKFVYEYDPVKKWSFLVELTGVIKEEDPRKTYPLILRKEGLAPAQYGVKGVNVDKLMDVEEKYDLDADEMAEGFGSEGEESSSSEDSGMDFGGGDSYDE
jgi:Plasmid pRiA4b ORF-3-like protein.